MQIELQILDFFLKRKYKGIDYSNLMILDRYLVHSKKETNYTGVYLNDKIKEMLENNMITENQKKEYSISAKGLEYLSKH